MQKRYLLIIVSMVAIITVTQSVGMLLNITPSMKLGLYIKANGHIQRGDIIAFCLRDPYKTLGLSKLYIQKGYKCNGADPLIKEVIAVPRDNVVLQAHYISVNDRRYFYETAYKDSDGKDLAIYPRGVYRNASGYWLIGTNAKQSWDSRYWGPIASDQVLYKLRPLLTW